VGLLLSFASVYVPEPIRRRKLEMLVRATADAFQTVPPSTVGLSVDECLAMYARFTREEAEKSMARGDEAEVRSRLFQNALGIGREFRRQFRLKDADVMRMGALVYRMLGIDFRGEPDGSMVMTRCFFSDFYSSPVCQLISSLDEGLLVGLAGGGRLVFSQRITEGHECCRAFLDMGGRDA
jgi:hypothetical protein